MRSGLFRRRSFWDALLSRGGWCVRVPSPIRAIPSHTTAIFTGWSSLSESRARLTAVAASPLREPCAKSCKPSGQAARIVFICPRASARKNTKAYSC